MKKERFLNLFLVVIIATLVVVGSVSAATTISTDITTGGVLTVSGTASSSFAGAVGIGTTTPNYPLTITTGDSTRTQVWSGPSSGLFDSYAFYPNHSANVLSVLNGGTDKNTALLASSQNDSTGGGIGVYGQGIANNPVGTTRGVMTGIYAEAYMVGDGNSNVLEGVSSYVEAHGAGTIGKTTGMRIYSNYRSGGTVNLNAGLYLDDQAGVANIASNNYQIYSPGTAASYFAGNIGIGTTTPFSKLHISAGASATTTVTIGEIGLSSSKGCVNMNRSDGGAGSFYINAAGTIIAETNYCR